MTLFGSKGMYFLPNGKMIHPDEMGENDIVKFL